jgi:hypothetical protein
MTTNINTILGWFKTGKKPTQTQFWTSWQSFWHKDETIPQSSIANLASTLNAKVEKSQFDDHITDQEAHATLFSAKENRNQKGVADGYAPLDSFTKLAAQYLNIVNDLTTGGATELLSAQQGKILKGQVDAINTLLASDNVNLNTVQEIVDAIETVQASLSTILVNDLTTGGTTKALTAEMGKLLQNNKVDKQTGKGLSTENYSTEEKALLAGVPASLGLKENKSEKGVPNGYAPLNSFTKLANQYLDIVNDLVTGGSTSLLSAEQGKLLQNQINSINTLLVSDNVNLDTVQEIVDAIETVQASLSTILVNDLTTGGVTKALTAEMGKQLNLIKENTANKSTSIIADYLSNVKFPTVKSVYDWGLTVFRKKALDVLTIGGLNSSVVLSDCGQRIVYTDNNPILLTVLTNAVEIIPIGMQYQYTQKGNGAVTVDGPGITFITNLSMSSVKGETRTLTKIDTDTWTLEGSGIDTTAIHKTGNETKTGILSFVNSGATQINGLSLSNNGTSGSQSINMVNTSTGYNIAMSNSAGGRSIDLNNTGAGVGIYTNNTIGGTGIYSNNVTNGIGIYASNAGSGSAIRANNSSTTGIGIEIYNSSTGKGVYSDNSSSGQGIYANNSSNGKGIFIVNSSTGQGFYLSNGSTGSGGIIINSAGGIALNIVNQSTGRGLYLSNDLSGNGIEMQNQGTGKAITITHSGSGNVIDIMGTNGSGGKAIVIDSSSTSTTIPFTVKKNNVDKLTINDAGTVTANSFIKSGGASTQFLKADGTVDSNVYASSASLSSKQDIANQVEVGASQDAQTSWHGKTVIFTANCTITIPATLVDSYIFNGVTLAGVTVTWAITGSKTWLFGTPGSTTEKQIFTLTQRGLTDSILLLGV